MIIPVLAGWAAGERIRGLKLTQHTKTAIENSVYYKPYCELQNTASQSIATSFVTLALPTVVEDTDAMANTANNRIVIKTAGRYRISGQCTWFAAVAGRGMFILVNGAYKASVTNPNTNGSDVLRLQVTRTVRLAVNDVITMQSYSTAATNTDVNYGGVWLSAEWVSL